jgi:hypothetical protein
MRYDSGCMQRSVMEQKGFFYFEVMIHDTSATTSTKHGTVGT